MVQFLSVVSTLFYCKTLSLTAVNVYELEARMILARFILWFSLTVLVKSMNLYYLHHLSFVLLFTLHKSRNKGHTSGEGFTVFYEVDKYEMHASWVHCRRCLGVRKGVGQNKEAHRLLVAQFWLDQLLMRWTRWIISGDFLTGHVEDRWLTWPTYSNVCTSV